MANDRQHILEIHRCCTRIIEESRTINNLLEILKKVNRDSLVVMDERKC